MKWHISHSMHAEHRGRTQKCPISNHRVDFNYSKAVGHVRIGLDKSNNLTECPIEFEVVQEFPSSGRDEKISLGVVRLNLSEYVEESETLHRVPTTAARRESTSFDKGHFRKRSSRSGNSVAGHASAGGVESASASTSSRPTSSSGTPDANSEPDVEEGIIRRHLMQESKINSTLKIGILMIQVDGDKNYVAPALKTAPVFGGIAGIMGSDQVEQDEAGRKATFSERREHQANPPRTTYHCQVPRSGGGPGHVSPLTGRLLGPPAWRTTPGPVHRGHLRRRRWLVRLFLGRSGPLVQQRPPAQTLPGKRQQRQQRQRARAFP